MNGPDDLVWDRKLASSEPRLYDERCADAIHDVLQSSPGFRRHLQRFGETISEVALEGEFPETLVRLVRVTADGRRRNFEYPIWQRLWVHAHMSREREDLVCNPRVFAVDVIGWALES
jgi:hypothetical protein